MPTYEYRCRDCGHGLEAQQSFSEAPLTECPACGGELRKKLGVPGIAFKGSGFYRNDNRSSSATNASSGTSKSSNGSDSSSTSTSSSSESSSSTAASS